MGDSPGDGGDPGEAPDGSQQEVPEADQESPATPEPFNFVSGSSQKGEIPRLSHVTVAVGWCLQI